MQLGFASSTARRSSRSFTGFVLTFWEIRSFLLLAEREKLVPLSCLLHKYEATALGCLSLAFKIEHVFFTLFIAFV